MEKANIFEGPYAKAGTIIAFISLLILIWQCIPSNKTNISGEWNMVSCIESASMSKYIGANVEWKLYLTQTGNIIKGTGEKIAVNNNKLDFTHRTKITIEGNIEDDNFSLNYTENGKLRETCGRFYGKFEDNNFVGKFSQTASDAKGRIEGSRSE